MKTKIVLIVALFSRLLGQSQSLTLEDIFLKNKYLENRPENLRFMKDDRFYTEQVGNAILKKETISGKIIDTIVSKTDTLNGKKFDLFDYAFSSDEKQILLAGNRKGIYRRSFTADYLLVRSSKFVVPSSTTNIEQVIFNDISYATFSPDGTKIGYLKDNNLFYFDLQSRSTVQVTSDGKKNCIINGSTDWVYEEEFEFTKAFFWSPDSRYLAFYRFDETDVPEYNMQKWQGIYPIDYRFKYPKAGEKNAKVEIKVFDLVNKYMNNILLDSVSDFYIPRIQWASTKNILNIRKLDRSQTLLSYYHFDPENLKCELLFNYGKKGERPIEIHDDVFYDKRHRYFLTLLEDTLGFKKIYNYSIKANKIARVWDEQNCPYEIVNADHVENKGAWDYYTCNVGVLETQCFRIYRPTILTEKISTKAGQNSIQVSEAGNYYIITNTSVGFPATVTLYDAKTTKPIRVLEDNASLKQSLKNLNLPEQTFFQFTTSENVLLNGWMIKPKDFDSTRKYPVVMFEYGGPGSQMVVNGWMGNMYLWHQFLASQGFVIVCVDGRGTGGRGTAFRTITYKRLGELETKDQIEAAKYLSNLSFVDKNRIGIWGWSFGGYLSTLSILLGNDVFKAAIAVAPVTSWRFYDTIYTERYLSTPQDNAKGYDNNSPLTYADRLKGNYLLIHGTSDDNVHFQNAIAMQEALIKAGKQFDTFVYPNKAHGISGGNTRLHLYTMMFNFWKEKLGQ